MSIPSIRFFATEDTERGPTEDTEVRPAAGGGRAVIDPCFLK